MGPGKPWVTRPSVIVVAVALCVACKGPEREMPRPPAKLAGVRVVDLIPPSLGGETWQDAEPFLALYASNPQLMAGSAFTPNPGGSASGTAPIFVSADGGDTWTLRNTLPSQSMTADITHAVGGNPPVLYAGIMKVPGFPLNELIVAISAVRISGTVEYFLSPNNLSTFTVSRR